MSLFLDVSITAQSIVDAAWARATANRERLRRRLDLQAAREEAGRNAGRGWEQRYTTPTPLQYRPDEPVAYPGSRQAAPAGPGTVSIGRMFLTSREVGDATFSRVYSGNGAAFADLPPTQLGSVSFVLPAGGDRIVFLYKAGGLLSAPEESREVYAAYLVSNTSLRSIPMPSEVQASGLEQFGNRQAATGYEVADTEVPAIDIWGPGGFLSPLLFPGIESADLSDYAVLRSYTDTFAPGFRLFFAEDINAGGPGLIEGSSIYDVPSTAFQWNGPDPAAGERFPLGDERWVEAPINKPPSVTFTLPAEQSGVVLHTYDWGHPAGCRAQLLQLGFSPADLEP